MRSRASASRRRASFSRAICAGALGRPLRFCATPIRRDTSMENILITGGAGFIGANFVHYWSRRHAETRVVVLDALTYAGNLSSIAPLIERNSLTFVRGDICDAGTV